MGVLEGRRMHKGLRLVQMKGSGAGVGAIGRREWLRWESSEKRAGDFRPGSSSCGC